MSKKTNPFDQLVNDLKAMRRKRGAWQPVMRKAQPVMAKAQPVMAKTIDAPKPKPKQEPLLVFKGNNHNDIMAKAEQQMLSGSLTGREFHRLDLLSRLAAQSPN